MRPLGTSPLWEPSSEDDSVQGEVVITEETNIVSMQHFSPAWLGRRPRSHPKFLQTTPKSVPKLLPASSKAQVTKIGGTAHRAELLRRKPGGEASLSTSRPVIDLTVCVIVILHHACPFELETRVLLQRLSCIGRSRRTSGLKVS